MDSFFLIPMLAFSKEFLGQADLNLLYPTSILLLFFPFGYSYSAVSSDLNALIPRFAGLRVNGVICLSRSWEPASVGITKHASHWLLVAKVWVFCSGAPQLSPWV